MKTLYKHIYLIAIAVMGAMSLVACDDNNTSDLMMDGSTMIQSMTLGGYEAEIDNTAKSVFVGVPVDCDLSAMSLDKLVLSDGAKADIAVGEMINCEVPRNITITNGDVYTRYTLIVKHDDLQMLSLSLNNKYLGSIDNVFRSVNVIVPINENLSSMSLYYTLSEGAVGSPASGVVLDFTNPVTVTATYRTAVVTYTINVIKDEMSQEPKAFIGNADCVDNLSPEAKAAATWMLANVPNSKFVSLWSVLDGSVKLSEFRMVWCHFDWLDWPGVMWDTRDLFNDYYIKGGNILASRDGARYINDVWRIAKDQQSPNNMFGGENYETLDYDLGFTVLGHENHPLYEGIDIDGNNRILLVSSGCSNSNRTLQWGADWGSYGSMAGWEDQTGAVALASGHDYDFNRVTIAEFAPRAILDGYVSGRVITIGTPAYEWYSPNGVENRYSENIIKLTKNAINYICQ